MCIFRHYMFENLLIKLKSDLVSLLINMKIVDSTESEDEFMKQICKLFERELAPKELQGILLTLKSRRKWLKN